MTRIESNCAVLSYLGVILGFAWEFIYGAGGSPHGSFAPQTKPIYLFILPVTALALASFVFYSAAKRGRSGTGFLISLIPIITALFEIFLGIVACINASAH